MRQQSATERLPRVELVFDFLSLNPLTVNQVELLCWLTRQTIAKITDLLIQ